MSTRGDLGTSHVLLTGATGFLGQALLERLLTAHPDTRVTALVRPTGSLSAATRVGNLARKSVFGPWRERAGEAEVRRHLRERVHAIEGTLADHGPLPGDLDIVLHSASMVSFDLPIDGAFATNVSGAAGLYGSLAQSGADPYVVHVSTAYVNGLRKGIAPEARLEHTVDWTVEHATAQAAREHVEFQSRRPNALRDLLDSQRSQLGRVGPRAVADAAETARLQWVDQQLVEWGRLRAHSLGWTDVYTFTKALAERVAEEMWSSHRLAIVRPSIIESALCHPYPGWIDGFKVADPLILAYGRGQLPDFPALPDSILDVIPVDYVVNATLAIAANPPAAGDTQYFQVVSGSTNPLPFHSMYEYVHEYFTQQPIPAESGPVTVPSWTFPGGRRVDRSIDRRERSAVAVGKLLARMPSSRLTRRWAEQIDAVRGDLTIERDLIDLYRAYVQTELIFDDARLRELHESLPVASQDSQGFDVTRIDWRHYLMDVHFPSITGLTRAFANRAGGARRSERPLPPRDDIVAVFDLEGTVLKANLVEQYLMLRLSNGNGGLRAVRPGAELLVNLPRYVAAERRDRSEFIRTFLRQYEGLQVIDIEHLIAGPVGRRLRSRVLPGAVARVQAHRDAGHRTVLVTGGIDLIAAVLEPFFDEVVASRMDESAGVLTGYLAVPPLVGEARAAWLTHYAQQHGVDLTASYGYGDSIADQSWLQLLGHPTAVNPDLQLYRHAQRRGWNVVDWPLRPRTAVQQSVRTDV